MEKPEKPTLTRSPQIATNNTNRKINFGQLREVVNKIPTSSGRNRMNGNPIKNTKVLEKNPNISRLKKMMNANTVVLTDEKLDVLLNALLGATGNSYVSEILKIGGIINENSNLIRVNDPIVEKYKISNNNFQKIKKYMDAPSKKELEKQIIPLLRIQRNTKPLGLSNDMKNELNRLKKEYNGYKDAIYITTRNNIIIAKITIKPPGTSVLNYARSLGTPDATIKIELNSKYIIDSMKQKLRKMNSQNPEHIKTILKISELTNNALKNILKKFKNDTNKNNILRGSEEIKKHAIDEIKSEINKRINHLKIYKRSGKYQLVYTANGKDKYVSVSVEKLKNKINISGTNNAKR